MVKMIISEVQTQTEQIKSFGASYSAALEAVSSATQAIAFATGMSGKGMDSIKNYLSSAYPALCKAAIMYSESMVQANESYVKGYTSECGSEDLDSEELEQQIQEIDHLIGEFQTSIDNLERTKNSLSDKQLDTLGSFFQGMSATLSGGLARNEAKKKKLEEKLEKFLNFCGKSTSYFDDVDDTLLTSGMTVLGADSSGNIGAGSWNGNGFSIKDTTWITEANKSWKEREIERQKQKEEVFNNNLKKLEGYTIYAWPYEDPVTGEVTVSWFIDKDGRRLDNSELQNFLELYGKDLDSSYYQVVDWQKIQNLENAALRRGETYITGQKYEGLSKGTMQLNGYISTGYAFAQQSGLYDLAIIAGLSYVNSKVNSPAKKIEPNQNTGQNTNNGKDLFNYTDKVNEHMGNPDRAVPAQTLKDAISGGTPMPDPRGSRATMYYSEIYINGKQYNFEVLYDQSTNTIYHFKYDRRPLGPLPAVPKK